MPHRLYLKNQPPLVTIDDFADTYKDTDSMGYNRASTFLLSKVLLPLTYKSELFPELNIMISSLIWSGSVSSNYKHPPTASLSLDQMVMNLVEPSLSKLECGIREGANAYHLAENGAAYARLLTVVPGLFVSKGVGDKQERKGNMNFTIPDYYNFILTYHRNIMYEDKDLVDGLLRDHLRIFFAARSSWDGILSFESRLFSYASEEQALSDADMMLSMIRTAYPKMEMPDSAKRFKEIGPYKDYPYKLHSTSIRFTEREIINGFRHYGLFLNHQDNLKGSRAVHKR
ncbi:MAG: hypothetical protein IH934_05825 [Nanoarchaeota archaeon]|nr:hypothetical protein [Nanoarchaeota archaeon]